MQPCIRESFESRIFVFGVMGFVPSDVVTTMTGCDLSSLATKVTTCTGSQSADEQQSGSYHECDFAGTTDAIAAPRSISEASTMRIHVSLHILFLPSEKSYLHRFAGARSVASLLPTSLLHLMRTFSEHSFSHIAVVTQHLESFRKIVFNNPSIKNTSISYLFAMLFPTTIFMVEA